MKEEMTRRAIVKLEHRALRKLHDVVRPLTDKARLIEEAVLDNGWLGVKKKADASSRFYHNELDKIVQDLRNISVALFCKVEMNDVRVYAPGKELPPAFAQYFYASQHLTNVVTEDILSAPSLAMACMRIERWVALLKRTHETRDYFSANIILLALASAPVAKSGLEALLTKTANAVLAYYQRKYIDHEFMFNLHIHRLDLEEDFIPFLPVIAKGLRFIKETVDSFGLSDEACDELTDEKQAPYYAALSRLKNQMLEYQLTDKQKEIVHILRKEPLLSFEILFESRSASWVHLKRTEWLKVNLTMSSLKAFDASDRFYLAKQTIETYLNELQALGSDGELTHTRLMIIIRNVTTRESSKHNALRRYYRANAHDMKKSVRHIVMNIIRSYADILFYSDKAKSLEPRIKKDKLLERAESVSSELSGEIREPVPNFPKQFSFIYQKERELGLKADSPIVKRRMTPRKSLGFFEGKKSRRKREESGRRLERTMSV